MLPLDEKPFVIDANARTIDVKNSSYNDGVAVQGDQLAEILYFKIDRYFDAKDLDDANIFIQWTVGSGNNIESGLSAPIVIDIESEPNKIIFGWALSDKITAKAGNIQFAVRFYEWNDTEKTKLKFSWSTQTASIKVLPALNFDLTEEYLQQIANNMESENKLLIDRIKGSHTTVTDNEDAQFPIYVFNLSENENVAFDREKKIGYVDLVHSAELDKDVYVFKVQAKSVDSGTITYGWNYQDIKGSGATASGNTIGSESDPSHSKVSISFELTQDEEVKDKLYYEMKTNEGVTVYKAFDTAGIPEGETPKSMHLYEKFAVLTVTQVGQFFAIATNSKTGANSKSKESDICIVPMPIEPTISTNIASSALIDVDGSAKIGVIALNAETNGTHDGTLTYKWFMKNERDGEFAVVEGANKAELVLTYNDSDPKAVEGYYKVEVSNSKNGETVSVDSAECRVSYKAVAPVISFPVLPSETQIDFSNSEKMKNVKVQISPTWLSKWNISDELQYQWYFTEDETAGNGDVLLEGATEPQFTPTDKGKYYCVVTNVKNGSEASETSKIFFVV